MASTEKTNPALGDYHVVKAVPANDPQHPNDWHVIDTRNGEVVAVKYEPVEARPEDEVECPYCHDGGRAGRRDRRR